MALQFTGNRNAKMSSVVAIDWGNVVSKPNVLLYESQALADAEREQARENIAAVAYEAQSLTDDQKGIARENVGILEFYIDAVGEDITARLNGIAAEASGTISITLPAGDFIITDEVSFTDKNLQIRGAGSSVTRILAQHANAKLSYLDTATTIGGMRCLHMSGLTISKDIATSISAGGVAIDAAWSYASATGATKTADFRDVVITTSSTGKWWNTGLRLVDAGGVVLNGVRIFNQDSITDSEAFAAIEIVRDNATNITEFFVSNSYLRAYGAAFAITHSTATAGAGTVEGLNVVNTDMVTVRRFVLDDNATTADNTYVLNGVQFSNSHGNASRCGFDFGRADNFYLSNNHFSFQDYGDVNPAPLVAAVRCTVRCNVWSIVGNRFFRNASVTDAAPAILLPTATVVSRVKISVNSFDTWSAVVDQAGTATTDPLRIYVGSDNNLTSTVLSTTGSGYMLVNPSTIGTIATSATAPLVLNSTTGALSVTGSALSRTNDTNVTLTLGGTPASALLAATSLTMGWSGQLAISRGGTGASTARDAAAAMSVPFVIQSPTQVTHTGDTNETVLATIQIPAGAMGPNGRVVLTFVGSENNSANNKTYRVRFGGVGGTSYRIVTVTTQQTVRDQAEIVNVNSASSQKGFSAGTAGGWGVGTAAVTTSAVDTSAAVDLVITGTLANAADNLALEYYRLEIYYGA